MAAMVLFRFKKKRPPPDYSLLDTTSKLIAAAERRILVRMLLTPEEFGGAIEASNLVFVPAWVVERKAEIDRDTIHPLTKLAKFKRYMAQPAYKGNSLVPSSITVHVYDPGYFSAVIEIW